MMLNSDDTSLNSIMTLKNADISLNSVLTPIHHPRMSHQPNDPKYKKCYHYAEMLINILNHPIKIKHFSGEGDPLRTQGEGAYQSVTSTKERGSQGEGNRDESPFPRRGGGAVMSHPKRGGGTVMSPPKRGGGIVMSYPKGACLKGGSTNHNRRKGVGGSCGPLKHSISSDGFDIKKMGAKCVPYYSSSTYRRLQ